jgi:SPP1 family predicted phage head-tail adaptor
MNPGQFKRRIEIKQLPLEEEVNENGFSTENWQSVRFSWAMIKTKDDRINAYDFYMAAREQGKNTILFTIRYVTGITSQMRVIYKSRTFEILSVINDDELNKTLTIVGREVV